MILSAICIALVFSFALAKKGEYAWMGITTQTVDKDLSDAFNLNIDHGAIINDVYGDSPADKAGLKEDDIIISFNGNKIFDYDDLIDNLEDSKPGDKVDLTIMRDDKQMDINITLGEKPNNKDLYKFYNTPTPPPVPGVPAPPHVFNYGNKNHGYYSITPESNAYIGVELTDLTDQLKNYFGVDEDEGVLISAVEKDSPAEKAGLKAGDVIIKVDNEDVENYSEVKDIITEKDKGDEVSLVIVRNRQKKDFAVTVDEKENDDVYYFQAPDLNIKIPKMSKHYSFFSGDDDTFDNEDFREAMKEYREALDELKAELDKLKVGKSKMYREYYQSDEFKKQMQELKEEFKNSKQEYDSQLKEELDKLKQELKKLEKRIDD